MDVEKTIEFLLVETAKHDQQIGALTGLMAKLAERQESLDEALHTLVESHIKTDERFRETDERIRKLVSAIGAIASK